MRKIVLLSFICMCFASMARAQTGTIVLSASSTPTPIVVNQNCNYVVIQENSANPANSFTITLPGQSTGITYPAGAKFVFSAAANGYVRGQTLGTITVSSGTIQFIGIESIAAPTLPAKVGTGGGLSFVAALPAICIPGITAAVELSVAPYAVYYCSSSNTWSALGSGSGTPGGTNGQIQFNSTGAFGGFTMAGDCTTSVPNITCTKTNGVSFAPSATTDTTNASNIATGALSAAVVTNPLTLASGTVATTQSTGDTSTDVATDNFVVLTILADFASPPALGSTTPNSGKFTTINASGHVTIPGLQTTGTIASAVCLDSSGNVINSASANCFAATGSGVTLETNGSNNASQSILNMLNSSAFNGLTGTFTNTSAGNVQLGFTGALTSAGLNITTSSCTNQVITAISAGGIGTCTSLSNAYLASAAMTVNGQTCTLGSTCTIPIQTNSVSNTSQAGINLSTSTANTIGITVTPTNSATNVEKFEATGLVTSSGGGTGLSSPTAHDVPITEGTGNYALAAPSANAQCFMSAPASFATTDPSFQTCPSGFTNPMNTLGDLIVENATPAAARLAGPTTPNGVPEVLTDTPSAGAATAENWALSGIPVNNNSETTCSSYTLNVLDRATSIFCSGGSTATITLPIHSTSGFGFNFPFLVVNNNSGTLTLSPTGDSIDSGTLLTKWASFTYNNAAGNWQTLQVPSFSAFGGTCANGLTWSTTTSFGCFATLPILTGSSAGGDLSGTYPNPTVTAMHFGATQITTTGTAPTSGQCLEYNGTGITGAACSGSGGTPCTTTALSFQYNNAGSFGCVPDVTFSTPHTTLYGASGILDLSATAPTAGLKLPSAAGAVPTADGYIGVNTTIHTLVGGSNGNTIVYAAAATGTSASTTCTNQFFTVISAIAAPTCTTATLASAQFANQGTTTTVLHGNAAGNPAFGSVVSADLNITASTCTNQFITVISSAAAGTCTTATLASAQFANQGTTTTVLHGNAAGNPSFAALSLANDVTGQLAIGSVGSAGLSGTSPIGVASTGAVSCATCATGPGSSTTTDLASFNGTGGLTLQDSGIASGNVVTAASAAAAAKQLCTASGASKTCSYIDFPEVLIVPAANCNSATGGTGWSIPASAAPTIKCPDGTNNLGGVLQFADAANAQFDLAIPGDWDTGTLPYIKLFFTDGANTSGTEIFQVQVSCYVSDFSATDDVVFAAAQVFTTRTATAANRSGSENLQFNSTSMSGCVAGGNMIVKITRNTDTAASAVNVSKATVTIPRLLTVQAN
jgi:hypothetical protein